MDRERWLQTLTEACEKTRWEVPAYCLMRNHFHLVIETPQPNLVAGTKWLLGEGCLRSEWSGGGGQDLRGEFKRVERGWCLGGEEFRQELLAPVETRPGPSHFGEAG